MRSKLNNISIPLTENAFTQQLAEFLYLFLALHTDSVAAGGCGKFCNLSFKLCQTAIITPKLNYQASNISSISEKPNFMFMHKKK